MPANPAVHTVAPIDYRVIGALSLLLSLWLIAIDPVLDRDAILYLRSADAYLRDGLMASQQLYGRPLLSICFAGLHQLTGLPLLYAGLLLNSLFYALFCAGFVATVATLGGDRRVQVLAAIVVLSHPALNDQRSSILREPAYWAFTLLAFRELLLYVRQPGLKHHLRWLLYILLASLFRFEGLFFLALAPLPLLATSHLPQRLRHCLALLTPQLLVAGALLTCLLLYPTEFSGRLQQFPGIEQHIDNLLSFPGQFATLAAATGDTMLEFTAREDAATALLAGLAAVLLLNICRAITWPWVLLLLWGWRGRLVNRLRPDEAVLLRGQLLICLGYLAVFTLINRFMIERYASQFTVFALLYLPFILNSLWCAGRHTLRRYLVIALLLIMSLDSLHNLDYQKGFIRDAARWIRANTPEQASLVSNSQYIAYFSERQFDWDASSARDFDTAKILSSTVYWRTRDYMAMRIKRDEARAWQEFLQSNALTQVAVFNGGRHGTVYIVKLPGSAGGNRYRQH